MIAIRALVLCVAAGCAGTRPTPVPSSLATAPVESAAAPSTLNPSPSPNAVVSPSPAPTPLAVETPIPTPPPTLARIATADRDGIRVRIELERNPLPAGEVSWAKFTVTNAGRTNVRWLHDGCASVAGAYGTSAAAWSMGREQAGKAATFKAYALGGHIAQEPSPFATISFVPKNLLGTGSYGCADIGIEEVIKPGESRRQTRWWGGFDSKTRSIPPPGPMTLVVGAGYYWRGEEPDRHEDTWISFELPAWIVPGEARQLKSPAEIVDAALSDAGFAAFLETQDIGNGREAIAWYEPSTDRWEIGLLIWHDDASPRIRGVQVDPVTGAIVGPVDRPWDRDADGFP